MRKDEHIEKEPTLILKQAEETLVDGMTLKGMEEITKVYLKKYKVNTYNMITKKSEIIQDNWMIETDGVALAKVLARDFVDAERTVSNDITEII